MAPARRSGGHPLVITQGWESFSGVLAAWPTMCSLVAGCHYRAGFAGDVTAGARSVNMASGNQLE